jgi:hypothetical protein
MFLRMFSYRIRSPSYATASKSPPRCARAWSDSASCRGPAQLISIKRGQSLFWAFVSSVFKFQRFVAFRRTFEDSARRRRPVPRASWSFRLTSWTLPQRTLRKPVGGSMDDTRVQYISCFCLSHIHSHPYFARLSVLLSSDMMHHDAVSGSSCVACIGRVSRSVPRVHSR